MHVIYSLLALAYVIANDRDTFKNHLIACEYLQIDPAKAHDIGSIEKRTEHVLSQWNGDGGPGSPIRTTLEKYLSLMTHGPDEPLVSKVLDTLKERKPGTGPHAFQIGSLWGDAKPPEMTIRTPSEVFAERCAKLVKEGKLEILPGTVNDEYVKKELRHHNYDNYVNKMPKWPN